MIEAIGGRKVLVVGVAVLVGVALVFLKGDVPPNFLTLLWSSVGLFVAGNGIEHVSNAYVASKASDSEAVNTPPLPPVDHTQDLLTVADALSGLQENVKTLGQAINGLSGNDRALAEGVATVQQVLGMIVKKYQIDRIPDPAN